MSSILVYQESSQSQSQSHSTSFSLKLNNPSNLTFSPFSSNNNDAKCMWTTINETISSYRKHEGCEKEYVHPSSKRPSMSERSLQMCTESLCSETGAFFTDNYLLLSAGARAATAAATISTANNSNNNDNVNNNKKPNFPPPLTTLRGSNSLHVRPYREDGRLVIEVVSPSLNRASYLRAERSDGRLRMSLVREREVELVDKIYEEIGVSMEEGNLVNIKNIEEEEKEEEKDLGEGVKLINKDNKREYHFYKTLKNPNVAVLQIPRLRVDIERDDNEKVKVEFRGKMGKGEDNNYELSQRGDCIIRRCKGGRRNVNVHMRRLIKNWEPFLGGYLISLIS